MISTSSVSVVVSDVYILQDEDEEGEVNRLRTSS